MSIRTSRASALTAIALVTGLTTQAHAAGFQLKEQSSDSLGNAFAGATAKANDPSTIFYNPAGLSRVKGLKVESNAAYIAPATNFTDNGSTRAGSPDGGDATPNALLPSLYASYSLEPNVTVGLGINTPYGLVTEYDDGWTGQYHALKSDLMTINVQPTIAWQALPGLSVGGGINFQRASAELTSALPFSVVNPAFTDGISTVEGHDWGLGYTLGVLWEPRDDTRVGLSYRSRIRHQLDGQATFTNVAPPFAATLVNQNASATLITPDSASLGLYHDINDQWAVMSDISWTNWSTFKTLEVIGASGAPLTRVPENWEDSWFFSLGATWRPTPQWEVDMGIAYDQSPVPDEYRTARIPDSDRTWLALGVGYQVTDSLKLNAGYTHIFVKSASINDSTTLLGGAAGIDTLKGSYDSQIDIVSVGLNYTF